MQLLNTILLSYALSVVGQQLYPSYGTPAEKAVWTLGNVTTHATETYSTFYELIRLNSEIADTR